MIVVRTVKEVVVVCESFSQAKAVASVLNLNTKEKKYFVNDIKVDQKDLLDLLNKSLDN